jgi:hypothetical protein
MLLKLFHVNTAHNIAHFVSGIIFLFAAMGGVSASRTWFQIFDTIYAIVPVWGFAAGNGNTLWVVSNNPPVRWLHVGLAVVMLAIGFGTPKQTA